MLIYNKETKSIAMIAKDTGTFSFKLENYLLDEGDVVYFTVNSKLEDPTPLIQKEMTEFPNHEVLILLSSEDTNIPVGKYFYDIQVNTADGRVDTVVGPHTFKILGGVTY